MLTTNTLSDEIKRLAQSLGFSLVGVAPAVEPRGLSHFDRWLAEGYAGTMHYLPERRAAYAHPSHVLSGARSLVLLACNYRTVEPGTAQPNEGRVSRYAWGDDYHELLWRRLDPLVELIESRTGGAARSVVDTAPLLEREFAELAGLGWIGKNTLLLNKHEGSWFFLAAVLTDAELDYDQPQATDHCGTCRACLDACPTDAFVAPYVLDARRCISYLTIEHRGSIPHELRSAMGDWLFGCDVCQDVCPWNNKAPVTAEPAFQPRDTQHLDLAELLALDEAGFRAQFRGTPLWRAKRRGLSAQRRDRGRQSAFAVDAACADHRARRQRTASPRRVRLGLGPVLRTHRPRSAPHAIGPRTRSGSARGNRIRALRLTNPSPSRPISSLRLRVSARATPSSFLQQRIRQREQRREVAMHGNGSQPTLVSTNPR